MVVARAPARRSLGWQEGTDARPCGVSQCPVRHCRETGRYWCAARPLAGVADGVAALRHGLVQPPPARPAEQEAPLFRARALCEEEPPHLRHTQRDSGASWRAPPFSSGGPWAARARALTATR